MVNTNNQICYVDFVANVTHGTYSAYDCIIQIYFLIKCYVQILNDWVLHPNHRQHRVVWSMLNALKKYSIFELLDLKIGVIKNGTWMCLYRVILALALLCFPLDYNRFYSVFSWRFSSCRHWIAAFPSSCLSIPFILFMTTHSFISHFLHSRMPLVLAC